MSSYNENDQPRDPLGKFREKSGTSGASGVNLSADNTTSRVAGVIQSINGGSWKDQEVPLDMSGRESVSLRKIVDGTVVEGSVYDEHGNAIVMFTDGTIFSNESTTTPPENVQTDDSCSDKGFIQRWSGTRNGRQVTECSYLFPHGDTNGDDTWLYSRDDGNFDLLTHGDDYATEIPTRAEVDERFGLDCPLHSESNIDQILEDNAAFHRGETGTFHESF